MGIRSADRHEGKKNSQIPIPDPEYKKLISSDIVLKNSTSPGAPGLTPSKSCKGYANAMLCALVAGYTAYEAYELFIKGGSDNSDIHSEVPTSTPGVSNLNFDSSIPELSYNNYPYVGPDHNIPGIIKPQNPKLIE